MTVWTILRRPASLALAFAVAVATTPAPGAALGLPQQQQQQQRAACTTDVFRFCGAEFPNMDTILACLKKEKSNLSEGCRAAVESKR
jgi:hypothetical protein